MGKTNRTRKKSAEQSAEEESHASNHLPAIEDRSYLAYLRPTPRPFINFSSGHFPPGTLTQPHSHPCLALHGCLNGPLTLCTPEVEVPLDSGVFYLIAAETRHWWHNDSHSRHTAATLSLLFDTSRPGRWPAGTNVERCCRELDRRIRHLHRFTTSGDQELHHNFWLAADHLTAETPRDPVVLTGTLLTLLGQIKDRMTAEVTPISHGQEDAQQIRRLLVARVQERLSIFEIAREVGASPTRAKECFRQAFGCGIMTYFNQLKIWQAKRLLNDLSLTVEQVSHQLGFSSPSYFSRAFVKQTGVTPTTYRHTSQ